MENNPPLNQFELGLLIRGYVVAYTDGFVSEPERNEINAIVRKWAPGLGADPLQPQFPFIGYFFDKSRVAITAMFVDVFAGIAIQSGTVIHTEEVVRMQRDLYILRALPHDYQEALEFWPTTLIQ